LLVNAQVNLLCRFLSVLACMGLATFSAVADGKVFSRAAAVPVITPDQRAMLYFSNNVERLVIETSFVGEGTNFAWVVPLPSAPVIDGVSTNFFGYLNMTYQPRLILDVPPWGLCIAFGFIIALCIAAPHKNGPGGLIEWLSFFGLFLLILMISLPFFAKGGSTESSSLAPSASSVSVLNRQTVGVYDTATLSSEDGRALLDWLNSNGFHTPEAALQVISDYAKQGWVFVAATLNRDASLGANIRPHPLAFTFETKEPIYPLRLTGVENDKCTIELFVFGLQQAKAAGFEAEYCGKPELLEENEGTEFFYSRELFGPPSPGYFRIGNPELITFAMPSEVTTKLVGRLTAENMKSDLVLQWIPFEGKYPTLYSHKAAAWIAANSAIAIAVIGFLGLQFIWPKLDPRFRWRSFIAVLMVASICGIIRYFITDTTEVVYSGGGRYSPVIKFRQLQAALKEYEQARKLETNPTEEELLAKINEFFTEEAKNAFGDQPLRFEPTPGNLTMRPATNGLAVYWHDIHNVPRKLATFPARFE
jgi:hypothetical protein